jgi:hypothetical protein
VGAGVGVDVALGGGVADGCAVGSTRASPARSFSFSDRERDTDALQTESLIANSYTPDSKKRIVSSVAEIFVEIVTRRGSPAALVHVVVHPRLPPAWLERTSPGMGSKQFAVEKDAPAPWNKSSEPVSVTVTVPPGAPAPLGFGPQSSPHCEVLQLSDIAVALQVPESVGSSSARAE